MPLGRQFWEETEINVGDYLEDVFGAISNEGYWVDGWRTKERLEQQVGGVLEERFRMRSMCKEWHNLLGFASEKAEMDERKRKRSALSGEEGDTDQKYYKTVSYMFMSGRYPPTGNRSYRTRCQRPNSMKPYASPSYKPLTTRSAVPKKLALNWPKPSTTWRVKPPSGMLAASLRLLQYSLIYETSCIADPKHSGDISSIES